MLVAVRGDPPDRPGSLLEMANCVLVAPSYNEAKRFQAGQLRNFLSGRTDVSVLFVNDGSTPNDTLAVLKRLQAEVPEASRSCICHRTPGLSARNILKPIAFGKMRISSGNHRENG